MDLSSGPGLKAAVASFLNREDLAEQIPAFVRLAEATFGRELRVREMEKRVTISAADTLPADFVEPKSLRIASASYSGPLVLGASMDLGSVLPGASRFYEVVGNRLDIRPAAPVDATIELTYFARVPPLDLDTTGATSWLLTRAPDLYLYGSLVASAPFLVEDERLATWTTLAVNLLQSLNAEAERARTRGSPLTARRRTFG